MNKEVDEIYDSDMRKLIQLRKNFFVLIAVHDMVSELRKDVKKLENRNE